MEDLLLAVVTIVSLLFLCFFRVEEPASTYPDSAETRFLHPSAPISVLAGFAMLFGIATCERRQPRAA
jgi:hypothetical protein